ncbi:MAG: DUF3127 domain-containing protein [Chitinophagales bacterium]|nr:DUF3127 domain-containing protein [Chitinophagales bacterium]
MNYELTGRLLEKFPTEQKSERFRKREFVIETNENSGDRTFTNYVKFQTTNDKCDILDRINLNEQIKITFNIRGNRWEKDGRVSYFTNLEAWKIESAGAGKPNSQDAYSQERPQYTEEHAAADNSKDFDDLPF